MKGHLFGFEKLEVWQESRELCESIYMISKTFPDEEKFGLVSQLRRAVVSISSNLAEGSARTSAKDQAHFTQLAYSSLMEVTNLLILAIDLGLVKQQDYENHRAGIEKLSNGINALRKAQLKRLNN